MRNVTDHYRHRRLSLTRTFATAISLAVVSACGGDVDGRRGPSPIDVGELSIEGVYNGSAAAELAFLGLMTNVKVLDKDAAKDHLCHPDEDGAAVDAAVDNLSGLPFGERFRGGPSAQLRTLATGRYDITVTIAVAGVDSEISAVILANPSACVESVSVSPSESERYVPVF